MGDQFHEKITSTTKIVTKTVLLEIPVFKIRNFEEQSAAIWRQLVETPLTAACLSSLPPFSVPRAQEFSLPRAQITDRPIVVNNNNNNTLSPTNLDSSRPKESRINNLDVNKLS